MSVYPPEIEASFSSPRNAGRPASCSAAGKAVTFECGCFVEIGLDIAGDGEIRNARFRSDGCGYMIASAQAVTEGVTGIRLTELHGVDESLVVAATGEIPAERRHCAATVMDAIRQALAKYRQKQIEEFRGEAALVCTCFGITEDDINAVIERERPAGIDEIARFTNAGSGCGSCRMLIQEMIDSSAGYENAI